MWVVAVSAASIGLCRSSELFGQEGTGNPSQESVGPSNIARLFKQLGSDSYSLRQMAFAELWRLGPTADDELNRAVESSDKQIAESAKRLRSLNKVRRFCSDIQEAVELAEKFETANEKSLLEFAMRNRWDVAREYLDQHPAIAIRAQERFFDDGDARFLIQQLVGLAAERGDALLAWPLVSKLAPTALTVWTSQHLRLPLTNEVNDDVDRAVRLFMSGQADQALALSIPLQLKLKLIARGFQWGRLTEPAIQRELLGDLQSVGGQAALACVFEFAGNRKAARDQWLKVLGMDERPGDSQGDDAESNDDQTEAISQRELEIQAAVQLLQTNQDEPATDQLLLALLLDGRVEAIERYLEEHSRKAAYEFYAASSNYAQAFRQLGLESDLSNFESWLDENLAKVRLELEEWQTQQAQGNDGLDTAKTLSQVGAVLVGLGYRQESMQILEELIDMGQRGLRASSQVPQVESSRRQYPIWDWCILRWVGREEWRESCMEAIDKHLDELPRSHRPEIFSKLFPELGERAWDLWSEAPTAQFADQTSSREHLALDLLDHLERCDRSYFGPDAQSVIKDWFYRAIKRSHDEHSLEDDAQIELELARIAHGMGYSDLALELMSWNPDGLASSVQGRWQAAHISLDLLDAESAMKLLGPVQPESFQHVEDFSIRRTARMSLGQLDQARQDELVYWMGMSSLPWRGSPTDGYRVVDELVTRHRWDEALPLAERRFQVNGSTNYFGFWETRQYSLILDELERHQESADCMRYVFVEMLRPFSQSLRLMIEREELGLLRYSIAHERLSRSAASIENGDFDAMGHELDIAFQLMPLDVEPIVACYPRLVQSGQVELADNLFDRSNASLKAHLTAWPNDATASNNLAWMYAQCDRQLDEALRLSEKAVSLSPRSAVYLDTLAEVHFRRGNREKAIELTRDCVRLDPRDPHYRENLVRFSDRTPSR